MKARCGFAFRLQVMVACCFVAFTRLPAAAVDASNETSAASDTMVALGMRLAQLQPGMTIDEVWQTISPVDRQGGYGGGPRERFRMTYYLKSGCLLTIVSNKLARPETLIEAKICKTHRWSMETKETYSVIRLHEVIGVEVDGGR
jgi:hypothetical protein